jgi:hypothetical protein
MSRQGIDDSASDDACRFHSGVLLVVLSILLGASPSPIEVVVTPAVCMSGCDVRIEVRIEPDAQNRSLVIEADSSDYYSRSESRWMATMPLRCRPLPF